MECRHVYYARGFRSDRHADNTPDRKCVTMGVGTILIVSSDPKKIEKYCKSHYIREKCQLPHYGGKDEPYRTLGYIDCSLHWTCQKCHIETCSACTQIQFVIKLDYSRPKRTCMGCLGMSLWEYVGKSEQLLGKAGSVKKTGLVLVESEDVRELCDYVDGGNACSIPHGGPRDYPFSAIVNEKPKSMKCFRCDIEGFPSMERQFVRNLDKAMTLCSGCFGQDIWKYLAWRHREDIRTKMSRGMPDEQHMQCWSNILNEGALAS